MQSHLELWPVHKFFHPVFISWNTSSTFY